MKKNRLTVFGVTIAVALVFGTVVANSASAGSAPRWKVNGAFLGNGVSKEISGTATTAYTIRIPHISGFNLEAEGCKITAEILGSASTVPGLFALLELDCTFNVEEAPVCSVGHVITNKMDGTLVWLNSTGGQAGMKMHAESGTEIAKIVVTGTECPVSGEYPLTGELIAKVSPAEFEGVEPELLLPAVPKASCTTSNAILKWWNNATTRVEQSISQFAGKANPAVLCGTSKIKTTGGEKLGIFPG